MAASATATGVPKLCYSRSDHYRLKSATKKLMGSTKFVHHHPNCFSTTIEKGSFPIRASDPQREGDNSTLNENTAAAFTSQEDLKYLWKLGAGSVVGAAVIKYGSVLFPEMTKPNILEALIMISTPVIIAVFLLIRQSRVE